MHEDEHIASEPPQFSDYYKPSKGQKIGEMVYIGEGMMALQVGGFKRKQY